jgi:DNA-binding CsgD family transcriptional regulator
MAEDPAGRLPLLREAVSVLERAGDQYELALAVAELSQAQHLAGDGDQARASARNAHRLARQSGARIPQAGEPAGAVQVVADGGRDLPGEPAGLTEAELRVAALAAEGRTNRQIADALLITVSTVEQHLTRVYRKLRVRRRADLRTRLRVGHRDARIASGDER